VTLLLRSERLVDVITRRFSAMFGSGGKTQ
jgi:hypothetical protein